jgi:serine/threonine-protein kinase RsbW
MIDRSELRVYRAAHPDAARPMRHALASFLNALEVDVDCADDILMAVGEALANALEHAYEGAALRGQVELYARLRDRDVLCVDVADRGEFIEREARPGRGFGLRIVTTVARAVTMDKHDGTRVSMLFDLASSDAPEVAQRA